MAVLKRGDNTATIQLDANRRFAASFAMAWNLWTAHIGGFFRSSWKACLVAGVLATLWLWLWQSMCFIGPSVVELMAQLLFGCALLLVYSVVRVHQLDFVRSLIQEGQAESSSPNSKPKDSAKASSLNGKDSSKGQANSGRLVSFASLFSFKTIVSLVKRAFKPSLPLMVVWLVACVLVFVARCFYLPEYVQWVAMILPLLILVPVAGMVQSYVEFVSFDNSQSKRPSLSYWMSVRRSLGLCRHYIGGMIAMWFISLTILVAIAFVLLVGEGMVMLAKINSVVAFMQKEPDGLPALLLLGGYLIMFVSAAMLMFFTALWSFPQQIHIHSIVYKQSHHPRRVKMARAIN